MQLSATRCPLPAAAAMHAASRRTVLRPQIIGVDFTKSNEWTGKRSFGGRCLHDVSFRTNPYREAIRVIGRTLEVFDDDKLIPAYGFGTAETGADKVVSFNAGERPCHTFQEVEHRYMQLAPQVHLAGPTTFAPIIRKACEITAASGGQYHILIIVADGQVTRPSSTAPGQLSNFEQDTVNAIIEACSLPLSIILVGVGDGPWDTMGAFDDAIPARKWDNWQTVVMDASLAKRGGSMEYCPPEAEAQFALDALMEVPDQYNIINSLGLMGSRRVMHSPVSVIPPPDAGMMMGGAGPGPGMPHHMQGGAGPGPGMYAGGPPGAPYPGAGPPMSQQPAGGGGGAGQGYGGAPGPHHEFEEGGGGGGGYRPPPAGGHGAHSAPMQHSTNVSGGYGYQQQTVHSGAAGPGSVHDRLWPLLAGKGGPHDGQPGGHSAAPTAPSSSAVLL